LATVVAHVISTSVAKIAESPFDAMCVPGFTIVRIRRHSISDDSATNVIRVGSSARRGSGSP
jgi:hypothetical protein